MLFNSYEFIFAFLPIVFLVYFFLLNKRLIVGAKGFLVFSSLFFYSWWNIIYLSFIKELNKYNITYIDVNKNLIFDDCMFRDQLHLKEKFTINYEKKLIKLLFNIK